MINKAKQIDAVAGAQIQQAKDSGGVGFGEIHEARLYGTHDYNTVALNPDYGVLVSAVSLLHEWIHIGECGGGPSNGGTAGDGRVGTSCYRCEHAQMTANSWTLISNAFCELWDPASTGVSRKVVCDVLKDLKDAAYQQYLKCIASQCTGYLPFSDLANWTLPCLNCG